MRNQNRIIIAAPKLVALGLLIVLARNIQGGKAAPPTGATLLWKQDLTTMGCPAPEVASQFQSTRLAVFANEGRIVVATAGPPQTSNDGQRVTPTCLLPFEAAIGNLVAKQSTGASRLLLRLIDEGRIFLVTKEAILFD